MTDVDRIPCTRCGAMILPITAEQTGGQCMPCHKGLRQMWEWQAQRPRDPAPEWDPKRGDLLRTYTDAIDYEAPVVPPDVLVDIVEIVLGEPPDGYDYELLSADGWSLMQARFPNLTATLFVHAPSPP